jgi:uncharacterized repeat protein (TIGR01451 family)
VKRRFRKMTRQAVLVGLALGALVVAPGPQAARLIDANLAVSMTGTPEVPVAGQPVSYTATVVNTGPDQATVVSLTVTISGSRGSITAASGSTTGSQCTIEQGSFSARCVLGTLAVGSSAQMTATVATAGAGNLTVTAKSRSRTYDSVSADSQAEVKTHVAERVAPVPDPIFSTEFARPFSPHRAISIRWRASDSGSGVATFDVRYRAAPVTGGFGPYQNWLTATRDRSGTFTGTYGATYCFSFRATDYDGNTSAWTDDRCASVQLPPIALRHTSGWIRSGLDGGLRTRKTGASLSLDGVFARRIVLSALTGPTYGQIKVSWNGRVLRTINLRASSRAKKLITLGDFGTLRRGRLVLTVVSTRKTVAISALGVAKR